MITMPLTDCMSLKDQFSSFKAGNRHGSKLTVGALDGTLPCSRVIWLPTSISRRYRSALSFQCIRVTYINQLTANHVGGNTAVSSDLRDEKRAYDGERCSEHDDSGSWRTLQLSFSGFYMGPETDKNAMYYWQVICRKPVIRNFSTKSNTTERANTKERRRGHTEASGRTNTRSGATRGFSRVISNHYNQYVPS
jgi:hypothetical protein